MTDRVSNLAHVLFLHSLDKMNEEERVPLYKIVLAGDLGVGKTSIFQRYDTNKFTEYRESTFGLDKLNKDITIDGKRCKVRPLSISNPRLLIVVTFTLFLPLSLSLIRKTRRKASFFSSLKICIKLLSSHVTK